MTQKLTILILSICGLVFMGNKLRNQPTDSVPIHAGAAGQLLPEVDRSEARRRGPRRVVLSADERRLLVANSNCGSISILDTETLQVLSEWQAGESVSDLKHWRDNLFLMTDRQGNAVDFLKLNPDGSLENAGRPTINLLGSPGELLIDEAKSVCFVGGYWSRQLSRVSLSDEEALPLTVDVPFAIGNLTLIDDGRAILAIDAFGGDWATFKTADLTSIESGSFGARRVGGVGYYVSDEAADDGSTLAKLAVVTQPINRMAQAIRNDVHWGLMIANEIVLKDEDWFLDTEWQESRRSRIPLGGPGEAKGDPGVMPASGNGEVAIVIGGVNEVAIGDLKERSFAYVPTGTRPVHSCFSSDGSRLFVANELDDSITVVDVERYEVESTIKLGELPEPTSVDRGRRLFFDATVSHDRWMSCHSCNVEGHTSGFLNDNFSDQSFGAPKRILSLLGHGETAPFAWNGSAETMEDQVRSSIEITMQTDDDYSDEQISDLANFVKSLPAPLSLAAARIGHKQLDHADAGEQHALFNDLGCAECHVAPEYTSPQLRTVGLQDELGKEQFNPPSLIGVSQRQRFLHDARYSSLRELFVQDKHQLKRDLSEAELEQLLAFLNGL